MDSTLITTMSGNVFPKDMNDWKILFPEIPGKLKQLKSDGFKIVVLTNQKGINTGKVKIGDFQLKVQRVAKKLGVPLQLYACVGKRSLNR